ncbi:MAG TPA: hypothetical protein VNQ52_09655 [Microbacteriaceae bacterium]|nr:hypothetical protein [Microbacteriaceae bacterium]
MTIAYGYYLPLSPSLFHSVRFIDISPKTEGFGAERTHQHDANGTPKWVVSALVKLTPDDKSETETFTLVAPEQVAKKIVEIPELTPIKLIGLSGGKWSRNQSDRTEWSFQVEGVSV